MTPRRPLLDRAVDAKSSTRARADVKVTARALEARAGDRPALGEFIRLTQADVWRFVAHLAGREMADDLTQETYLRAMDALPSFRGESSARTWLLAIARRVAADHFRRQSTRPPEASPDSADRLTVPDASARVELERMLASLDPVRREALVLTQVFGLSYAEAAAIAGVAVGTIRSRVARARAELVDQWSDSVTTLGRRGPLAG
ncbi:sigma-70 family RNA polymerase sigma factor [Granulicoccus sp. GXG6511]|uniref:sigma-70 family RNA polymerase sigma factor n=1 Tax=Granulicoccus sp. GXG6511 TaxID=3381351 RepID=UPI003D7CD4BE